MSYSALRDKKAQLIRKALDGSVFIGPITAPLITAITSGAGSDLAALPTGYEDLGETSTDGATYGRTTNISNISSFGSVEPTRSDVTEDTITMQVTAQETKLQTIGLYTGSDVSALQAAFTTGEVKIVKPLRPSVLYHRVLGLFVDTDDSGREIYMARYMPRARITALADQKYNDADTPVEYNMTFTGYNDATVGGSHVWYWGGPGWLALLADMGITQATS